MIAHLLTLLFMSFFFSASHAIAETKIITAEATYIMGDGETPDFAEARTLQKAKQVALEEAGTYVQSYTRVQNLDLTTDEILILAGGMLQVQVLEKKRSLVADGLRFYTKIKAMVTIDNVNELAHFIQEQNLAEEYTNLQAEYKKISRELEDWKKHVVTVPKGQERSAALDQIREGQRVFAQIQKKESELFQRLVSGKQLAAQANRERGIVDGLLNTIVNSGYIVTVGAVQAVAVPGKPDVLALNVPITIRLSQTLREAVSHAVNVLGGIIKPDVNVGFGYLSKLDNDIGNRPLRMGTDTPEHATVTLVRLGKYRETAEYFQEGAMEHALLIEFIFESKPGDGGRCILGPRPPHGVEWFPLRRIFPVDEVTPVDGTLDHAAIEMIDNGRYEENRAFLANNCERDSEGVRAHKNLKRACRDLQARMKARRDIPHQHGHVAIVHDEATFVAQVLIKDQTLSKLTAVRTRIVAAGVEDIVIRTATGEKSFIPRCAVVQ